jgi:hypothetical protein
MTRRLLLVVLLAWASLAGGSSSHQQRQLAEDQQSFAESDNTIGHVFDVHLSSSLSTHSTAATAQLQLCDCTTVLSVQ